MTTHILSPSFSRFLKIIRITISFICKWLGNWLICKHLQSNLTRSLTLWEMWCYRPIQVWSKISTHCLPRKTQKLKRSTALISFFYARIFKEEALYPNLHNFKEIVKSHYLLTFSHKYVNNLRKRISIKKMLELIPKKLKKLSYIR